MTEAKSQSAGAPTLKRYRRLLPFIKPARWHILGGLLSGIAFAALSGLGLPFMLKYVLPIFFGKPEDASPEVVIVAWYLFGDNYHQPLLLLSCISLPLIFLLRGFFALTNRYLINYGGFVFLEQLRLAVFARLQALPLAFFHRHKSGDLVTRLVSDCEQLKTLALNVSNDLVRQPFMMLAAGGYLVFLSITGTQRPVHARCPGGRSGLCDAHPGGDPPVDQAFPYGGSPKRRTGFHAH